MLRRPPDDEFVARTPNRKGIVRGNSNDFFWLVISLWPLGHPYRLTRPTQHLIRHVSSGSHTRADASGRVKKISAAGNQDQPTCRGDFRFLRRASSEPFGR